MEEGWFQQKLADSAYATFKKIDSGEKISVGVNKYADPATIRRMCTFTPMTSIARSLQIDRLNAVRANRDNGRIQRLLKELAEQAQSEDVNLLPKRSNW